jgi:hypothetical protein
MLSYGVYVICIIFIVYLYNIQYKHIEYNTCFVDDIIDSGTLKTGDMVLFKAANNFNCVVIGCYFGHMGIVYVGDDNEVYIFESNGIEHMSLKPHHNERGIFISKLRDRVKKYKGRAFVKRLNKSVDPSLLPGFVDFMNYCLNNMYYDTKVIQSAFRKKFCGEKCHAGTNCGEIVFLSLIKLGLLSMDKYDWPIANHVKYMANITDLDYGYSYAEPLEMVDHPFDS